MDGGAFLGPPEATDITGGEEDDGDESGLEETVGKIPALSWSPRLAIAARQIAMHIYGNPDAELSMGHVLSVFRRQQSANCQKKLPRFIISAWSLFRSGQAGKIGRHTEH